MEIGMILKTQLKKLLGAKGITASRLSRMSGVPRQVLSDWLAGTRPRNLDHVKKVADALGVTIDQLCFGDIDLSQAITKEPVTDLDTILGNGWVSGIFEVRFRRMKKTNGNE